jgi:DNA-binding MarR family transcriptional regulator
MIFDYIAHDELDRIEELLVCLHHFRRATAEHLAVFLGIKRETVVVMIHQLNKKGKYIEGVRTKGRTGRKLYHLGQKGCIAVSEILGERVNYYNYSKFQGKHHMGNIEILVRLVEKIGIDQAIEHLTWYNTKETKRILFTPWREAMRDTMNSDQLKQMYDEMIEPDSRLLIGDFGLWLEYDNDTEKDWKVKRKFDQLIEALVPIQNKDPVIWVAPTEKRRKQLQIWWEEVQNKPSHQKNLAEHPDDFYFPPMYFFVAGEETETLIGMIQKSIEKVS